MRPTLLFLLALVTLLSRLPTSHAAAPPTSPSQYFRDNIAPFLTAHCLRCHGDKKQSGGVRLDQLSANVAKDAELWNLVRDQIREGLMPPGKETQPRATDARAVADWIVRAMPNRAARLPQQGNLIPHELLFGSAPMNTDAPSPRVWRLSPAGYMGFVQSLTRGKGDGSGIVQPFTLGPERGVRDYAELYTIDEPSTEILLRNAERIVGVLTGHDMKDGKVQGRNNAVRELVALMNPKAEPSRGELEKAIQQVFKMAIGREADSGEVKRLLDLHDRCAKDGDRPAAVRTMLQAVLLKTDALFRSEVGKGKVEQSDRKMLGALEVAVAVSLALGDRREQGLMTAAQKGELTTSKQVADHIRRILEDPKIEKPGLLRFFHEYFDYANATNVFKNKPMTFVHEPRQLVADTDRLVLHVLAEDKDVFRTLLTTDKSFVNLKMEKNKKSQQNEPKPGIVLNPNNNKGQKNIESVYGIDKWTDQQPVTLPKNTRLGILMQPSWLVAYSTNFENDPVRRGRWVRERLLGGTVPELPIGVVAQIPDEPQHTLRHRLRVTREPQCWKCHRRMDDLGLVFENFDHYGRFRKGEEVLDEKATAKNNDKKGKPLGPVMRDEKLDTSGKVSDSGDEKLDGDIADPRELVTRLASSVRVRQVFVRHAFRFFLGRNETLSDARTLQVADRAYVESGGSFKALVVSLLTSESFLYRSAVLS